MPLGSTEAVCTESDPYIVPDFGAQLVKVVDMIDFPAISQLFGIDPNTATENTGPTILIHQDANGQVVAATNEGFVSMTPDGDINANGATINLLAPGLAKVVLGATPITMKFINMPAITL